MNNEYILEEKRRFHSDGDLLVSAASRLVQGIHSAPILFTSSSLAMSSTSPQRWRMPSTFSLLSDSSPCCFLAFPVLGSFKISDISPICNSLCGQLLVSVFKPALCMSPVVKS